jgi:hypothetical protein
MCTSLPSHIHLPPPLRHPTGPRRPMLAYPIRFLHPKHHPPRTPHPHPTPSCSMLPLPTNPQHRRLRHSASKLVPVHLPRLGPCQHWMALLGAQFLPAHLSQRHECDRRPRSGEQRMQYRRVSSLRCECDRGRACSGCCAVCGRKGYTVEC